MNYSKYISAAFESDVRFISIPSRDDCFLVNYLLSREIFVGPFSAYDIHLQFKKSGISMAYKNVHQKVQKILALGLIEEAKREFNLHAAKCYRLSLNGWMYLILHGTFQEEFYFELALRHSYDENIIFKTLLYPFLELETLAHLDSLDVSNYLENCCDTTIRAIGFWKVGIKHPRLLTGPSWKSGPALALPNYQKNEAVSERSSPSTTPRTAKTDHNQAAETQLAERTLRTITKRLDLLVKSFLFQQIMKHSTNQKMESVLSKDRKFMLAIQDLDKEFMNSHDRLFTLRQDT